MELLKKTKSIELRGKSFGIDFLLTSDYKMLLILLGKKAANADDACIYCRVSLTEPPDSDAKWPIFRSLNDYPENNDPIIDFIEYKKIVVDCLHMLLRVSDSFYKALLAKLSIMDGNTESIDIEKRPNLKTFITFLIENCKISNPYYISKKSVEKFKFRHFTGNERLRIFKEIYKEIDPPIYNTNGEKKTKSLQTLFPNIVNTSYKFSNEDYCWSNFFKTYMKIKNFRLNPFDPTTLEAGLKKWLKAYLKIRKDNLNMTTIGPYHHIYVFHLVELINVHRDINQMNTQGLEKLNGFCINYYHKCTNRHYKDKNYIKQLICKRNRIEYIFSNEDFNNIKDNENEEDDGDYNQDSSSSDNDENDDEFDDDDELDDDEALDDDDEHDDDDNNDE